MSREIKVFTACEQEDLTWQLAWCLADDDREATFKENWLEYECTDAVFFDGVAAAPFCVFLFRDEYLQLKRALGYIFEWSLAGHAPSQRAFAAFTQAMLGISQC